MIDGTAVAKKIVACVQRLPSNFGVALITDVLTDAKIPGLKVITWTPSLRITQ